VPPLNLVGDFGGGGIYLALGIVAALFESTRSGKGQVIDAAMTEGAASLMAMIYGFAAMGTWSNSRGSNVLDGGAFFYDTYETADGKWLSIAPVEPNFFALLREKLGLVHDPAFDAYMNPKTWTANREKLDAIFRTKTLAEWRQELEGTDACFAPVLTMQEAKDHPHMKARQAIVAVDGVPQPNVAPRFSRTEAKIQGPPPQLGGDTEAVLRAFGLNDRMDELRTAGAI
jgi:alpha-methylacyl-CoA racemase